MRTTITLEEDAFAAASAYAQAKALKFGVAVSELIRQATSVSVRAQPAMRKKNGVWVFNQPKNTPKVTAAQVKEMLDETP